MSTPRSIRCLPPPAEFNFLGSHVFKLPQILERGSCQTGAATDIDADQFVSSPDRVTCDELIRVESPVLREPASRPEMVSLRVSGAFSASWRHRWCRQFPCEGQAARKSVRHQNRDRHAAQHIACHPAQYGIPQAGVTVRAHHHEVTAHMGNM